MTNQEKAKIILNLIQEKLQDAIEESKSNKRRQSNIDEFRNRNQITPSQQDLEYETAKINMYQRFENNWREIYEFANNILQNDNE